jgi:predicted molibdopterin-dependent oxidoreductase YjgC
MNGRQNRDENMTIDGKAVKIGRGQTILQAARKAGIYIPTLCHLENLEAYGGCRLCIVEVEGMKGFPASCTTPATPGMKVVTRTPGLQQLRKEILEFTLSEHPYTCLVCRDKGECTDFMHPTRKVSSVTGCNFCPSSGDCELQDLVEYLELDELKFPVTYRGIPPDIDNPFYNLDYNLCVLCGRCVRICGEERNSHVLSFVKRGNTTIVGTAFGESQMDAGCEFCGACVDVCPTGSISEKMGKWREIPDRSLKTACSLCPVGCEMNVNSRNGQLVGIGPKPGKREQPPQLCIRGKFLPQYTNGHPSRITTPLVKKNSRWVEVDWKEALSYAASGLKTHKGSRFGLIASGQDTLEDTFALQKFARSVMGSDNVDLHGSYPEREVTAGLHRFFSSHPPPRMDRVEKADTLLVIGLDGSASHPLLENRIRKTYRKGNHVIHASATPSRTSYFASISLRYRTGAEAEFLRSLHDQLVSSTSNEQADTDTDRAISQLLRSREVVIIAGDDLLRGSDALSVLETLNLLQTFLGNKRSCGTLFAGFEGNLYGGALTGAHPCYRPGFKPAGNSRGLTLNEMVSDPAGSGVSALMVIGDLPEARGLEKLGFLIQCNMFRTGISEHADVLLPITDFLENEGHVLTMDLQVKKVNRVLRKPDNTRTIPGIVNGLASAMGATGFSSSPSGLFRELKPHLPVKGRLEGATGAGKIEGPLGVTGTGKTEGHGPSGLEIPYNHFRYRGNNLHEVIAELERVTGNAEQ